MLGLLVGTHFGADVGVMVGVLVGMRVGTLVGMRERMGQCPLPANRIKGQGLFLLLMADRRTFASRLGQGPVALQGAERAEGPIALEYVSDF